MGVTRELPVIGLCRFSFVGRGDWSSYRNPTVDHNDQDFRTTKAAELYQSDRMERRFFTLENFLLKSMAAQVDQTFYLIILTSDLIPDIYKQRLEKLCAAHSFVRAVFSSQTDVDSALIPEIDKIRALYGTPLVQFRIDDDDFLSPEYVGRLRTAAKRFEDLDRFAYSIPKGLVATAYSDMPQTYYELVQPFHSAGCALKLERADRTVFSFGHFSMQRRFPAFIDNGGFGHVSLKLDDQDSEKLHNSERARRDHTDITKPKFNRWINEFFSAIDVKDIERVKSL